MTFYFTLKSIPELTELPPRIRWQAWFACVHKTLRHWQTWLACVAAKAPILVFIGLFSWLIPSLALADPDRDLWLPIALAWLGVTVLSAPGILILSHIQSEIIRPYLREYLAARGNESGDTIS